jgi:Kef-type K+ transport system membrane component KefB
MTLLLLQMAAVLLVSLCGGWIAARIGQAKVIGEIVGGILIGPSVFGRLAPRASLALFPSDSLSSLEILSTVGLILFLFLVGTDLDYEQLRRQRLTATLGSLTSIVLPFALALLAAPFLHLQISPNGADRLPFALFLGISMSITAFPVLARILEERNLQATPLGTTALMCAALDDVCAWSLLAVAMALLPSGASAVQLSHRIVWLIAYLLVMLGVVRPLGMWFSRRPASVALSYERFGIILVLLFASAAATDAIGIHPLFGAFLAGLCFPRLKHWQQAARARLDVVVSLVLLPLFFALTGLRTRLDLLTSFRMWLWTGLIILLAIVGKVGGAVMAARWTRQTWRDSLALGALLNTRGLVELIVLNIAYQAHIFAPALFTMLVIMALVTTAITVPALNALRIGIGIGIGIGTGTRQGARDLARP